MVVQRLERWSEKGPPCLWGVIPSADPSRDLGGCQRQAFFASALRVKKWQAGLAGPFSGRTSAGFSSLDAKTGGFFQKSLTGYPELV
jgi:hypothetical protein